MAKAKAKAKAVDNREAKANAAFIPSADVTFTIEDVTRARKPLRVVPARQRFQSCLQRSVGTATETSDIEAMSEHVPPLLNGGYDNGFLSAAISAFAHHHPIILSPDHFWLLVLQAVALHVEGNAEVLRCKFVSHEGKKRLTVLRDDFVRGAPSNDWAGVVREFVDQIDGNLIDGVAERLNGSFSTTGLNEDIAAKVTVMDMCKNYFEYRVETECGIPEVTLEGSAADWALLCRKSQQLVREQCLPQFAEWWLPILTPVLEKIAASAAGDVDAAFWQSFVKRGSKDGSGGFTFISGWINCLFPLLGHTRTKKRNRWCQAYSADADWVLYAKGDADPTGNQWGEDEDFGPAWGPDKDDFPNGWAEAPVVWKYLGSKLNMRFIAGLFGSSQNPDTLALRPEVGWAIVQDLEVEPSEPEPRTKDLETDAGEMMLKDVEPLRKRCTESSCSIM